MAEWILLAEDDKLFATLFLRFWKQLFPEVKVETAASTLQVVEILKSKSCPPSVVVLDLNLEDGSSQHLKQELDHPVWLWSASRNNGCQHKPMGRSQMSEALRQIAKLGRLDVPSQ